MALKDTTPEHKELHLRVSNFIKQESDKLKLSQMDVLCLLAYMTGQAVALQDQTKVTVDMALDVVAKNLELGNKSIIDLLEGAKGNG